MPTPKRILILNQFVPPDRAPTAALAGDLAQFLRTKGLDAQLIGLPQDYTKKRRGPLRAFSEIAALSQLQKIAASQEKPDLLIAFSSPPLLALKAAALAAQWNIPWMHWCLDLYPDVALALGKLPRISGPPLRHLMRRALHSATTVLAVDTDMQQRLQSHYEVRSDVSEPWITQTRLKAFSKNAIAPADLPWSDLPGQAKVWLYSGNLGLAHRPDFLIATQHELEKIRNDVWLVAQGGGAGMRHIKSALQQGHIRQAACYDYAPEETFLQSLAAAPVRVVVQDPRVCGILNPSKTLLLEVLQGPLIWLGDPQSCTARKLHSRPQTGIFPISHPTDIARWIANSIKEPTPAQNYPAVFERLEKIRCQELDSWWAKVATIL